MVIVEISRDGIGVPWEDLGCIVYSFVILIQTYRVCGLCLHKNITIQEEDSDARLILR